MNTHRLIHGRSTDSRARHVLTTIVIPALIWAAVGFATALAGGKLPAGHHHEEANWTAPAEAITMTTSICTTPSMVTNKCRTQTAERRRYRRHQEGTR